MKQMTSGHLQSGKAAKRKGTSGYALIEALLIVAGIGTMALASISLQDTLTKNQSRVSIHSQLGEVRRLFLETLNNPAAWQNMVNNSKNGILNCLENAPQECHYLDPRPITAEISKALNLSVDPQRPELGFDLSLQGCDKFKSDDENSPICPFRAEMGWKPICSTAGECKQIEILVNIVANPAFERKYAFASGGYSFRLRKNMNLKNTVMDPNARIMNFQADSAAPKALKVFLIVDNSVSMTDDRLNLANGLKTFVDGMQGFDVTYYVYTTDVLFEASMYAFPVGFTSFANLMTDGKYLLPDGREVAGEFEWDRIPSNNFVNWTGNIVLRKDFSARMGLNLKQTHDQTDLSTLKNNLVNVMKATEDPRANMEAGLCTLSHILNDQGPNNPLNEGDSAIFLTISDEDDSGFTKYGGNPYLCVQKTVVKPDDGAEPWHGECDLGKPGCDDGVKLWVQTFDGERKIQYFKWRLIDQIWDDQYVYCYEEGKPGACGVPGTTKACTRADIPVPDPSPWVYANSCYETVERWDRYHSIELEAKYLDSGGVPNKNYCKKAFTYKGVAYADGVDYLVRAGGFDPATLKVGGDCWQKGLDFQPDHWVNWAVMNSPYEPSKDFTSFKKFEKPMMDLYNGIPGKLRERFGADGYGLYNVIHDAAKDTEAGCSVVSGESSYGTRYKQVLLASDTPGGLISVCKNDYSDLLHNMKIKAQQIARDTYVLNGFDPDKERVYSVQVAREGGPVIVAKSDYGISGTSLQFKAGFLQGQDRIQVVILPK